MKRHLFRIGAAVVVPLLLVSLAEIALRLANAGHPTSFFLRASLSAQRLRTGQFLATLLRNRGRASPPPNAWGGLRMFQDRHLPLDHPGRERVYRHLRQNLCSLVRIGIRSRVPILLSTAASNLRDCAPFASAPPPSAGGSSGARWEALCQFREVLQLDPANQTARDSVAALERRPGPENP